MNYRNHKGINMITLSVAVVIIILISSALAYNTRDGMKSRNLRNLYNDIELLNNKISNYYLEHGDIPKLCLYEADIFYDLIENSNPQINPNDSGANYYVIDLSALEGVSLNYGKDYGSVTKGNAVGDSNINDIYIINEVSHTIYYPRGVEVNRKSYYTIPDNWTKIDLSLIPIYTAEQLSKIGTDEEILIDGNKYIFSYNATYILKNDIDLSTICYRVDGTPLNDKTWHPLGSATYPFTGALYGNGHEIKGLYINDNNTDYCGLFGYANSKKISNVSIKGTITCTGACVGGLVGYLGSNGNIDNCINNVEIEQNYNGNSLCSAGGIVGNSFGNVTDCKNYANITSNSNNIRNEVGGIAGNIRYTNGKIKNCYNTGNIRGISNTTYSDVGGICGQSDSSITESFNEGTVYSDSTTTPIVGGIIGVATGANSVVSNCYNKGIVSSNTEGCLLGGISGDIYNGGLCEYCYSVGNNKKSGVIITNGKAIGVRYGTSVGTIKRCYGLDTNYSSITNTNNSTENLIECELKSSMQMKQQLFVDLLNDNQEDEPWMIDTLGINDGYPILKWQTKK